MQQDYKLFKQCKKWRSSSKIKKCTINRCGWNQTFYFSQEQTCSLFSMLSIFLIKTYWSPGMFHLDYINYRDEHIFKTIFHSPHDIRYVHYYSTPPIANVGAASGKDPNYTQVAFTITPYNLLFTSMGSTGGILGRNSTLHSPLQTAQPM